MDTSREIGAKSGAKTGADLAAVPAPPPLNPSEVDEFVPTRCGRPSVDEFSVRAPPPHPPKPV